jgi:predicted lipoprotein with Yx(FWY)xxD motif
MFYGHSSDGPMKPNEKEEVQMIRKIRWSIFLSLMLIFSLALSACAGTPTAVPATTAPTKAPTTAPAGPATIAASATVMVGQNPQLGNILVDSKGMTLYTWKNDSPNQSNCTAGCAQIWPPLTVPDNVTPTAAVGVPGNLAVIDRSDGSHQVAYNGMLLYRYTQDSQPGDANGQGLNNLWYVVSMAGAPPVTP